MKLHRNAKSTPSSRLLLVRRVLFEGWSYPAAAEGAGMSVRTVAKWVKRFRTGGVAGLEDGSSRPATRASDTAVGRHADPVVARATWVAGVGDWPGVAHPAVDGECLAPPAGPESPAHGATRADSAR